MIGSIKHVLYFGFLAILIGCASQSSIQVIQIPGSQQIAEETSTSWSPSSGLMIIGVRAYEMNNRDEVSKQPALVTGISVKNEGTGAVFNIALNQDSAIKILPKGEYCINSFRTYQNVELPYCKAPFFSIISTQTTNLGYVLLGVNYRGRDDSVRYWPYELYKHQRELTDNLSLDERKVIWDFIDKSHPNLKSLDNTIWYSYTRGGIPYAMWFNKGGAFYLQYNPGNQFRNSHEGSWNVTNDNVSITLKEDDVKYDGRVKGDFMSGVAQDTKEGDRWVWFALRGLPGKFEFNSSPKAKMIFQNAVEYPKSALAKGITGYVRMDFKLPLPQKGLNGVMPTAIPDLLRVVVSRPAGVFDKAAMDAMQYAMYANGVVNGQMVSSDGEETITFQIVNGKPAINYATKLEAVERSLY
jgi:hypothetical protein